MAYGKISQWCDENGQSTYSKNAKSVKMEIRVNFLSGTHAFTHSTYNGQLFIF